jgi:hypothetical protein
MDRMPPRGAARQNRAVSLDYRLRGPSRPRSEGQPCTRSARESKRAGLLHGKSLPSSLSVSALPATLSASSTSPATKTELRRSGRARELVWRAAESPLLRRDREFESTSLQRRVTYKLERFPLPRRGAEPMPVAGGAGKTEVECMVVRWAAALPPATGHLRALPVAWRSAASTPSAARPTVNSCAQDKRLSRAKRFTPRRKNLERPRAPSAHDHVGLAAARVWNNPAGRSLWFMIPIRADNKRAWSRSLPVTPVPPAVGKLVVRLPP